MVICILKGFWPVGQIEWPVKSADLNDCLIFFLGLRGGYSDGVIVAPLVSAWWAAPQGLFNIRERENEKF